MDGAFIPITFSESQDVIIVCNMSTSYHVVPPIILSIEPNMSNVEFDEGTGTITITGATAANEGTYTCIADDEITTPTNISFVLTMYVPTTLTATTPILIADSVGEYMSFLIAYILFLCIYIPSCSISEEIITYSLT